MITPSEIETLDINKVPKEFADGMIGGHSKEFFTFLITVGNKIHGFATTPAQFKECAKWMTKQVESYEKKHGEIDLKIESMFTAEELKASGNKDDEQEKA